MAHKNTYFLIFTAFFLTINAATININDNEDCPFEQENQCQNKDLFCCASKGNICCTEDEYFSQFPSLNESHAEPRNVVKGLLKLIGILVGVAAFTVIVCCVCCFCCPFCLCHKHNRGKIIRRAEDQPNNENPMQPQPSQQPLQPPPPSGYPSQPQQGGYPPAQPYPPQGGPPYPGYPDNPPPYPGPPLENAQPLASKGDYDRQPAYNPGV